MKNNHSPKTHIIFSEQEPKFQKLQMARVFKNSQHFTCGMCGKAFLLQDKAWDCVIHHVTQLKSFPVYETNSYSEPYFQCLFCGKIFVNDEDAALCLSYDLKDLEVPNILLNELQLLIIRTLKGDKLTKRSPLPSRHRPNKVT